MKRILAVLIVCCLLSIPHKLLADGKDKYLEAAVRPITHATADSTVKLYVKVSSTSMEKLSDKHTYYWEKDGVMHQNQGSFSGNILHGKYTVINAKGLMITEGYFVYGTKDGSWKKWDDKGVLTHTDVWEQGYLKKSTRYSDGKLFRELTYGKNGKLKKKLEYTSGKKTSYAYKNNAWVAKRKLKLFSKRQTQTETNNSTESSVQ